MTPLARLALARVAIVLLFALGRALLTLGLVLTFAAVALAGLAQRIAQHQPRSSLVA